MFGFRKESPEIQRLRAQAEERKYKTELEDIKVVRKAAETKQAVRKERQKIKELKSAPRREFIDKLKKNVAATRKKLKSNKSKANSVFGNEKGGSIF